MACRIRNLTRHPLYVDLLGGETLHLPPGGVSGPLREERLVGNCYLREWTERGIARVESVRMTEVLETEQRAASPPDLGKKGKAERGEKGGPKKAGGPSGRRGGAKAHRVKESHHA